MPRSHVRLWIVATIASGLAACGSSANSGDGGEDGTAELGFDAAPEDIPTFEVDGIDGSGDPDAIADAAGCDTLGCACSRDEECASGYCVDGGVGVGRVCSEYCSETCSLPGYDCVVLVNSGGDAVQLCVPVTRGLCRPCASDGDCARLDDVCLEMGDGRHCAPDCSESGACPAGARCEPNVIDGVARALCVPETGSCTPCVDEDGDGFGVGSGCDGVDCDDEDEQVHEDAAEVCDGRDNDCDELVDEDVARNACGGCAGLGVVVGAPCGACDAGTWVCSGTDVAACSGAAGAELNACGGCDELGATVGDPCGACATGSYACDGVDDVSCVGDLGAAALNSCGGCGDLGGAPGDRCGTCGTGSLACGGPEALQCVGDDEAAALNACGGCSVLPVAVGASCGPCGDGAWECEGMDSLVCAGATPDSDGDSACDDADACAGHDDRLDGDGDGIADGCDACPGSDDRVDADGDGVPTGCDVCLVGDDGSDVDRDAVPDACDCDQAACDANADCGESSGGPMCSCRSGYTGDGLTCAPVDCGTIAAPANGSIALTGTTWGNTATASCNTGWTLQGSATRTCTAEGTWDGTRASCYRPPGNITCTCSSLYSVGSRVVSITGAPGFQTSIGLGRYGTVIAGSGRGGYYSLLVQWDGWYEGHDGNCFYATCGSCSEGGSSKYWVECSSVAPAGP